MPARCTNGIWKLGNSVCTWRRSPRAPIKAGTACRRPSQKRGNVPGIKRFPSNDNGRSRYDGSVVRSRTASNEYRRPRRYAWTRLLLAIPLRHTSRERVPRRRVDALPSAEGL